MTSSNTFPTHVFLVQNSTLSSTVLSAVYKALTTNMSPSLLAVLGVDAITHARASGAIATATYSRTQIATGAYEWSFTLSDTAGSLSTDVATDAYTLTHLQSLITTMSLNVPGFQKQVTCQPSVAAALASNGVLQNSDCSILPPRTCSNYFATQTHYTISPNSAMMLHATTALIMAALIAFALV